MLKVVGWRPMIRPMRYWLAFLDPDLLDGARAGAVIGRCPRLRFVSLVPRERCDIAAQRLPEHVRRRVVLDPSPEFLASGAVDALLCDDPEATQAAFPGVAREDILTWDDVVGAYDRWLRAVHLRAAAEDVHTPDGLIPLDWRPEPVHLQLVGSCGAEPLVRVIPELARELDAPLSCEHVVRNHPVGPGTGTAAGPPPTLRLVVPPLRYMHPHTLDDFVRHPDPERLLRETVEHMTAYLDAAADDEPPVDTYVCGFIEPHMNPLGVLFPERRLSNFKYFVRALNDAIVAWCERSPDRQFVDADAIAAGIGKAGVDEGPLTFYSHGAPLDHQYDDCTDAEAGFFPVLVRESFDIRTPRFARAIVRQVLAAHVIRGGRAQVKAVIVDLDDTLWRGRGADGSIGPFNGRPQGLIEALLILRRRGILLAIASKNDDAYIRAHWDEILYRRSDVPLTVPLALDDFDATAIDLRPKSETVAELLAELNVLPEHAVFIDDNPLEREQVQAAFPTLRVLGAELNHVRRELIHSPFTQRDVITAEDRERTRTVTRHAELVRAQRAGSGREFLHALGLRCHVADVRDSSSAEARRAVQLLNKTNQWTLNGRRFSDAELEASLATGARLVCATVEDARSSYGLVAVALVAGGADEPSDIVLLAVSCRVIGMGIDDALLSALLERFGPLQLSYSATDRNRAATEALQRWLGAAPEPGALLSEVARPDHVLLTCSEGWTAGETDPTPQPGAILA